MTLAPLEYRDIRQAVLQLPQRQRLQLIKDAILTLSTDEPPLPIHFDFDATLIELQHAFAATDALTDQEIDDVRYAYLMEKYSA